MAGKLEESNWDKSLKSFPPCYLQSPLHGDFHPPRQDLIHRQIFGPFGCTVSHWCSITHISIYTKYKKFLIIYINVSASFCNLRVLVISPHNLGDDLVELIGDFYDLVELIGDFYDLLELTMI